VSSVQARMLRGVGLGASGATRANTPQITASRVQHHEQVADPR
jgi:hypothetical protein